ncbi:AAA domain containing protein [Desulfocurvibacter africanus PCS]|uniref:AAA domain containing protein n=1 Tax=Desulfocurvibacter africanus PCS TaxID=1262666 RepID=M5Q3K1_DESAF|nr:ATP-binding protein [Desulfocurvibacter africanus]EMG38588.1 AAA domain containing protein [Desulfocurvibacter africanus PCS]
MSVSAKISHQITFEQAMKLSDKDKLLYFDSIKVLHPIAASTLDTLETTTIPESGADIVLLIGPTGVGKTTISKNFLEKIIKANQYEIVNDKSYIPIVYITAPASGESVFSWRIFYHILGNALNEPLMNKKFKSKMSEDRHLYVPVNTNSTIAGMRMAIEKALGYRKTYIIVVDEAAHLLIHASERKLIANMNSLKSLASIGNLTIVLVGSYELYSIPLLNAQLSRRSAIVHFCRYRSSLKQDIISFKSSIYNLSLCMPVENLPDLTTYTDSLMSLCAGCIGILKVTLKKALVFALRNKKWSEMCLEKAVLTKSQIQSILSDILKGEEIIENAVCGTGKLNIKKRCG